MTDDLANAGHPAPPDPAAVAAMSSLAAALLGVPPSAAGDTVSPPTSPLPSVAVPASSGTGRYASTPTAVWVSPEGREVPYLLRRRVPQPEELATAGWDTVPDGDRADLLANRDLGDPTASWRLADANLAFDIDELEEAGRLIRIALPEGFPGGSGA